MNTLTAPLSLTKTTLRDSWCLYTHAIDRKIAFIGMCELPVALNFPDARSNSEWQRMTADDAEFTALILSTHPTRDKAFNERHKWMQINGMPICNARGHELNLSAGYRIECVETGKTYPSQAAACRELGCSTSAMCNHIKGAKGFKTVKGYTFRKVWS